MKKIFYFCCIFLSVFAVSQAAEPDSDLDQVQANPARQLILPNKEVKYVAGKDGKWFTSSDTVYQYFLAEYDAKGKMTRRQCYENDQLKEYWVYEYDRAGRPLKETFYKVSSSDNKSTEAYYALFRCNDRGQKINYTRYAQGKVVRRITYEYDQQGRLVRDTEYTDRLEKYHRRLYDKDGRIFRMMEYHADHQGPGPDGVWFTADDVVSSTKVFLYNDRGLVTQVNKYIGAGPDNTWFTDDDQLQYYTLRYYDHK